MSTYHYYAQSYRGIEQYLLKEGFDYDHKSVDALMIEFLKSKNLPYKKFHFVKGIYKTRLYNAVAVQEVFLDFVKFIKDKKDEKGTL